MLHQTHSSMHFFYPTIVNQSINHFKDQEFQHNEVAAKVLLFS